MSRVQYLLRDEFKTDEAAPLASPRVCEPGPGTLTITDGNGIMSINDGELIINSNSAGVPSNTAISSNSMPRRMGRAFGIKSTQRAQSSPWVFGFNTHGWAFPGPNFLTARINTLTPTANDLVQGIDVIQFLCILRNMGAYLFFRPWSAGPWTLQWIDGGITSSDVFVQFSRSSAATNMQWDDLFIADIGQVDSRFSDKSELATSKIDGTVQSGATFTHDPDCQIEWTQTALPVAGTTKISFRKQDSDNYWFIRISAEGHFILYERVAGVETGRASLLSSVTAGANIKVVAQGTTIQGYINDVLSWSYPSATSFQTLTDGMREAFSGNQGGTVSNLRAWPTSQDLTYTGDYGLATSRLPGNVSVGQTFNHEADFVMEFTVNTLPPEFYGFITFRQVDSSNCWALGTTTGGTLFLQQRTSSGNTNVYTSAGGTLADGNRVVVIADGSTIRIFNNNTLLTTYQNAINFQNATSGVNLGGWSISNLATYPRYVELPLDSKPHSLFGSRLTGSNLFGGTL